MAKQTPTTRRHDNLVIRQPLRLYKERKRRYVRLEIAAPVIFAPIDVDKPLDAVHLNQSTGTILNISGGGALMETTESLAENSFITMDLELAECEILSGIVGKVKRVDENGDQGFLIGVEFCSEDELTSVFGAANIGSVIASFDNKVKRFLLRYIFTSKVNQHLQEEQERQQSEDARANE